MALSLSGFVVPTMGCIFAGCRIIHARATAEISAEFSLAIRIKTLSRRAVKQKKRDKRVFVVKRLDLCYNITTDFEIGRIRPLKGKGRVADVFSKRD